MASKRPIARVVFSHGKESGPWGRKITALAVVVRDLGLAVESVDYRGLDDPTARVARLLQTSGREAGTLVLVGSSMGGHVAAAAASRLEARGLFLLAPAFYMPGYESLTPHDIACPVAIVHGWHDDVVPVGNTIRWATQHRAALHVLDSGHRLDDQIDVIGALLRDFLTRLT